MSVLSTWLCVDHMHFWSLMHLEEGVLDPLNAELQVVGSHLVLLELDPVLSKAQQVLLTVQPSLRSLFGF